MFSLMSYMVKGQCKVLYLSGVEAPTLISVNQFSYSGAQCLYKAIIVFPFYAYTLRCLVPRCCRVSLQPGLVGYYSISFLRLQCAETLLINPIEMESPQRSEDLE